MIIRLVRESLKRRQYRKNALRKHYPTCYLYYNQEHIIVATQYVDVRLWCVAGEPMYKVPFSSEVGVIDCLVMNCLKASRSGLSIEAYDSFEREPLRKMGIKRPKAMWRSWNYMYIEVDDDEATIKPMHPCKGGGYIGIIDDPVYKVPFRPGELGKVIRQILDSPPLKRYVP